MMELYFNHTLLFDAQPEDMSAYLREVTALAMRSRSEGARLKFYESMWQVNLRDGRTIHQFLYSLPKTEDLKLVLGYVDSGPHYIHRPMVTGLAIEPNIEFGTFAEHLMHICFVDNKEVVVSPSREQKLTSPSYRLSHVVDVIDVYNLIGEESISDYLRQMNRFSKIGEVFTDIEGRGSEQLVIMSKAKKSAQKHHFLGRMYHVFEGLLALETVELKNVLEEVGEKERIEMFRQATGLEISKEHPETLKDRYYRKQREFVVPGYAEKQLFEWHIKIGRYIRIHYFVDKQYRKVYVGHCGEHLEIDSYRS